MLRPSGSRPVKRFHDRIAIRMGADSLLRCRCQIDIRHQDGESDEQGRVDGTPGVDAAGKRQPFADKRLD